MLRIPSRDFQKQGCFGLRIWRLLPSLASIATRPSVSREVFGLTKCVPWSQPCSKWSPFGVQGGSFVADHCLRSALSAWFAAKPGLTRTCDMRPVKRAKAQTRPRARRAPPHFVHRGSRAQLERARDRELPHLTQRFVKLTSLLKITIRVWRPAEGDVLSPLNQRRTQLNSVRQIANPLTPRPTACTPRVKVRPQLHWSGHRSNAAAARSLRWLSRNSNDGIKVSPLRQRKEDMSSELRRCARAIVRTV